jgi:chromosome partitioning protein
LVLRTRTNPAYRTRNMSFIAQAFDEADIPTFRTEMNEREAFKAVFGFG